MHSPGDIAWLLDWLRKIYKSAPKRQWRWAAYGSNWDSDEIRETFKDEATADGATIWKAIFDHEQSDRWPKLTGRAAHFLRERLLNAIVVCESWLREHTQQGSIIAPTRPSDSEALARWILIVQWDQNGVAHWLETHRDEFQEPDEEGRY
jgi:hypothetical protein